MITGLIFVIVIFILVIVAVTLFIGVISLAKDNHNLAMALEKIAECKKCPVCGMIAWKVLNPEEKNNDKR